MSRLLQSSAMLLALSGAAVAQDLPQAGSDWFKAGAAAVEARAGVQPITGTAKNVILFTADGNGVGTNYAIRLFAGQKAGGLGDDHVQPAETLPHVALVKTYSTNGQTPDSAPTASAMNSGIKTRNDLINVTEAVTVGDCAAGLENGVTTFAEIASQMGKSVGVISTARITHATPAAVYARTAHRDWENDGELPEGCDQKDIADQLIEQMKAGVIDIALGGGRSQFLPEGTKDEEGKDGKRKDGRNLIDEAKAAGAEYAGDDASFAALSWGANKPVLGLFEASHMKYEHDRTGEPSLAEMTEAAIKALSANENGFYLNVEAGRVDHANHDGNLYRTLTDGVAFQDAIAKALEMTNAEDTLIIVTADHEHAIAFNGYCGRGTPIEGLCYEIDEAGTKHLDKLVTASDGRPYSVAGFLNGPGSVLVEQETTAAPAEAAATDAAAATTATAEATATPEATPEAAATDAAAATTPEATVTPEATATPQAAATPEAATTDAAATTTPEATVTPEATATPEAAVTPEATPEAATTDAATAPAATTTPEAAATDAAATPAATATPDATATSATATPEATPTAADAAATAPVPEAADEAQKLFAAPDGRATLTQEEAVDPDFLPQALLPMSSETHSGEDVAVFARGPWAHLFDGVMEQNEIFHVMNKAVTTK